MKLRKALGIIFVAAVAGLLAAGLLRALFLPKAVNGYENRLAAKLPPLTLNSALDGSFQDGTEAAFGDQIVGAETLKRALNLAKSEFMMRTAMPIAASRPDRYFCLDVHRLFGGTNVVYRPSRFEDNRDLLVKRAGEINELVSAHPELDFYVYYIETDPDINFETGERSGLSDFLFGKIEGARTAKFSVGSFETFREEFYRTDHHWNAAGSLRGARELAALLGREGLVPDPKGEETLGSFSGSKAKGNYARMSEPFTVYKYDLAPASTTVNGVPADYGAQEAFLKGGAGAVGYGAFYGPDAGEAVFYSGGEGRLLVLGESYDNAVLRLLAPGFEALYAVDLRYYEAYRGEPFDLDAYVRENGIDSVLLVGCVNYFILDDFVPGGER